MPLGFFFLFSRYLELLFTPVIVIICRQCTSFFFHLFLRKCLLMFAECLCRSFACCPKNTCRSSPVFISPFLKHFSYSAHMVNLFFLLVCLVVLLPFPIPCVAFLIYSVIINSNDIFGTFNANTCIGSSGTPVLKSNVPIYPLTHSPQFFPRYTCNRGEYIKHTCWLLPVHMLSRGLHLSIVCH